MDSSHFFDLPVEERGPIMDQACVNGGVEDFFDLPAEERAAAYDSVEEGYYN
jgi:hypothetical protein